jgi:predicted RNA-binding Zn-ribbon protein involved in translation (DUF1610 family)
LNSGNLILQLLGENYIYILVIVFVAFIAITFVDSLRKRGKIKIESPHPQTELVCPSCGLKEVRRYKDGDFIKKKTDETCKDCGHESLEVRGIYAEPSEEESGS